MSDTAGPVPAAEAGPAPGPRPDAPADRRAGRGADRRAAGGPGRRGGTARWGGLAELRADVLPALRLTAVLVLTGIPAGLLWWLLAPREDYRVLADGGVAALGDTSAELFAADDAVFVLVMAGLGLLAGLAGWLLRRRRGVALLAALAAGTGLAGVLAWQLGELLGPGPTREQLTDVGATVTTRLELASLPAALMVAPFVAVLVYVVATLLAAGDDLGRTPPAPDARAAPAVSAPPPGPALQADPAERRFLS
ncbi:MULTISPECIES: LPXTG cell wall anchor domain-containing protein [unclassified Blastococcus]